MRYCYLFFIIIITVGACKSSSSTTQVPKDATSSTLLEAIHQEIKKMALFILDKSIQQLQTSIPVEEKQALILEQHPKFQQLIQQQQKAFTTWFSQQSHLTEASKKEALSCLEQNFTPITACSLNPILQRLNEPIFLELDHDIRNYSVQLVLDKNWIPANETGYDCSSVQKGNFYYYMPGGSSEVVYVTRTDNSQRESLEGEMTYRKVTWSGNCKYSLTAWEANDNFQLNFEIVHVASDHYLFLCKAPYKGTTTTLLLGRVNKSLE